MNKLSIARRAFPLRQCWRGIYPLIAIALMLLIPHAVAVDGSRQANTSNNRTSVCKIFSSQNPVLFAHVYRSSKGLNLDGCIGYAEDKMSNGKEMSLEAYLDSNTPEMHQALSQHYHQGKRLMLESFPNVEVVDLSSRNCPGAEMYRLTYPGSDISYGYAYLPCHTHLVRVEAHGHLMSQIPNISHQLASMRTPSRP